MSSRAIPIAMPRVIPAQTVMPNMENGPTGLLQPGNINLVGRPVVKNADGTISSEYSTSFGDENGREILVPTVVNGRFLTKNGKKPLEGSDEEREMFRRAQQHYEQSGEHLGIFDSPDNADAYAQIVHSRQMRDEGMPTYVLRPPANRAIPPISEEPPQF